MATRTKRATTSEAHQMLELLNSLGGSIFRQLLWQKASDLDLTYAQSQVLFRLAEHPGSHMGDVAKAFGVTLPAVTHIVDRLEEKGLVRDVLALPDPTRVGRGDSSIATGASVFANGVRLNRQTFH